MCSASPTGSGDERRKDKEVNMIRRMLLLLLLLLLVLLAGSSSPSGQVTAQGETQINWWIFAGGGGSSECGDVQINTTLGQAVVGTAQEGDTTLTSGFWTQILEAVEAFLNFLPVIFH